MNTPNTCRFYNLPIELQLYIYEIIDNDAANTIIKFWYKYLNRKVIAVNRILNLPLLYDTQSHAYYYDPNNINVINTFTYCDKVLSGSPSEDSAFWVGRINKLENGIYFAEPTARQGNTNLLIYKVWNSLSDKYWDNYGPIHGGWRGFGEGVPHY